MKRLAIIVASAVITSIGTYYGAFYLITNSSPNKVAGMLGALSGFLMSTFISSMLHSERKK